MSNLLLQCRLRAVSPRVNPRFFRGFSSAAPSSGEPLYFTDHNRRAHANFCLGLARTSYIYPPQPLTYISPRPTPPPTNAAITYTATIESELQSLPVLVSHRSQLDASEWYETRPYRGLSESWRNNSLTAGTLHGPGKLACAPLVRVRRDETESLIFVHVGRKLCGHEGIVHGGLLATLLDEGMGRTVNCHCLQ
jgi:hypothetical protein